MPNPVCTHNGFNADTIKTKMFSLQRCNNLSKRYATLAERRGKITLRPLSRKSIFKIQLQCLFTRFKCEFNYCCWGARPPTNALTCTILECVNYLSLSSRQVRVEQNQ